jgi:hypothetical protein
MRQISEWVQCADLDRTKTLIHDLLQDPNDFTRHVHRATASLSSVALYGQRAKLHDDFWATVSLMAGRESQIIC